MFLYHIIHFKIRFKPYRFDYRTVRGSGYQTCDLSKMRVFFLNRYCLTKYFDSILQHINIVLYDKRENDMNGWLVVSGLTVL